MSATRPARRARSVRSIRIGIVLLALGALCWLARGPFGGDDRSWSAAAVAPSSFAVTLGQTYHLSTVGGLAAGAPSDCTWYPVSPASQASPASMAASAPAEGSKLSVVATTDARVIHRVASFIAPASGRISIVCFGADQVFVDDADGLGRDPGSVLLLATIVLGTLGLIFCAGPVMGRRLAGGRMPPADPQREGVRMAAGDEPHHPGS